MGNNLILIFGAVALFISSMVGLVYIPQILADKEITTEQYVAPNIENGHRIYVREGCVYCHTQQVRPKGFGADFERGWGEASLPEDYKGLTPHVLGTMRTGPDLANIGRRQPSRDWHYTHLFAPESVSPGSIMPPFPWLFEVIDEDEATNKRVVNLPGDFAIEGKKVIPTEEAEHLVDYLLSLNQERTEE
ncbi:cbb3-type cytochrome c oxidase subunit II [Gracilimonas sp. Q87]|uniref:cbb3-type cytochrome c oxidase subunit II n=1 Tax=Gracilimonas sp. Q87 TaxID=3384766 RepID=UPI00398425E8